MWVSPVSYTIAPKGRRHISSRREVENMFWFSWIWWLIILVVLYQVL